MLRLTIRGLRARKMRAFGTALAVFLGVALVSGTYILTDTIDRSFGEIFDTAYETTDVVVSSDEIVKQEIDDPPPFDESLVETLAAIDGVETVAGEVFSLVRITRPDGETIGVPFSPQFATTVVGDPFNPLSYVEGRPPETSREAAIDSATADKEDLSIGDGIGVVGDGPLNRYEIVGINRLGDTSGGGSSMVTLTLSEGQRVSGKDGKLDAVSLQAGGGLSAEQLRDRVAEVLPAGLRVETGGEAAERQTTQIGEELGFLRIALLVFAGISLVVAAFQIFNTFSITVAQRIKEFGMLRTLGASRRQLLANVLAEASLIGVVASVIGVAAGIGFAHGINALFKAIGIDLPSTGTVLVPRTIVIALALGIGLTLMAALAPALRATRVSPMAALLEGELPESRRRGRVAAFAAALLAVAGLALLLAGLFGGIESSGQAAGMMGGGAAAILFAVSLYSPRLVRPLASVVGKPLERLPGVAGRIARENAMRKPGRTATTAAALMIGLTLVVFVSVFAAGLNRTVDRVIDENFLGDVTIQSADGFSPIPSSLVADVEALEGVGTASVVGYSFAEVNDQDGRSRRISGVDPDRILAGFAFNWVEGDDATIESLTDEQTVVSESFADGEDIEVGDRLRALTPTGTRASYEVTGIVKDRLDLLGSFIVTRAALARDFGERRPTVVLVRADEGVSAALIERNAKALVADRYPSAEALNNEELRESSAEQLGALLGLIYALLSLAIVVSIFGIVNTLALSIHERTRELGMLRAVGMTRRQVKRVIRYEAVITALIGAILGTALGVLFAALISRPLAEQGFELVYPIGTLIAVFALAALAGVLAAIGPARRASKLDVLKALSYE